VVAPRLAMVALGNDLLGDDAVGLLAARALAPEFAGRVECIEAPGAGMALLEELSGFDRALLLDSMLAGGAGTGGTAGAQGGDGALGRIHEFVFRGTQSEPEPAAALARAVAPSPHYSSVGEVMALARRLDVPFPQEVHILALTVADPYVFGEGLSLAAAGSLASFTARGRDVLRRWCDEPEGRGGSGAADGQPERAAQTG
jgi:hydrogenase maturation protease